MESGTALVTDNTLWTSVLCCCFFVGAVSVWLCLHCLFALATLSKYMNAIENYDRGNLLRVISFFGTIGLMVGIFGGCVSFLCLRMDKAYRLRYVIYSYLVWGSAMILVYIIAAACTYANSDFKETFSPGFSIVSYSKDVTVKKYVDALQQNLACCGNKNYIEWFPVPLSKSNEPNQVTIPDSCCNANNSCIKTAPVTAEGSLTPYRRGCLEAASVKYSGILTVIAMAMGIIALIEVLVIGIISYVQATNLLSVKPKGEAEQLINRETSTKETRLKSRGKTRRKRRRVEPMKSKGLLGKSGFERTLPSKHRSEFQMALEGFREIGKKSRLRGGRSKKRKRRRSDNSPLSPKSRETSENSRPKSRKRV